MLISFCKVFQIEFSVLLVCLCLIKLKFNLFNQSFNPSKTLSASLWLSLTLKQLWWLPYEQQWFYLTLPQCHKYKAVLYLQLLFSNCAAVIHPSCWNLANMQRSPYRLCICFTVISSCYCFSTIIQLLLDVIIVICTLGS